MNWEDFKYVSKQGLPYIILAAIVFGFIVWIMVT
jgi:hypothetical protein